ncbi:MAG TPA: ABC transporter permease [Candidatus Hydrogenedentes bacterium]|nr:ABC transporter permease [Candidatus Hydrogenedentota bacterium]
MNSQIDTIRGAEPLTLVFAFCGGLVLLFLIAPLAGMVLGSPFATLAETAADPEVRDSIWLTLWTSMAATLLLSVAAIPFAYLLARRSFPLKGLVSAIIDLPIVVPHSAAGIAILGFVSSKSVVGGAAERIGIHFVGGAPGIMAAMAFVSLPFLINAARDGFAAVPERFEKAALNLGASPARVFATVSVPLAWRSILSGLVLMWARGLSEFGAVAVVAYHPIVTPVLIYERFGAFGLKYARPVAALFLGVCLVFFLVIRLLARRPDHATR